MTSRKLSQLLPALLLCLGGFSACTYSGPATPGQTPAPGHTPEPDVPGGTCIQSRTADQVLAVLTAADQQNLIDHCADHDRCFELIGDALASHQAPVTPESVTALHKALQELKGRGAL